MAKYNRRQFVGSVPFLAIGPAGFVRADKPAEEELDFLSTSRVIVIAANRPVEDQFSELQQISKSGQGLLIYFPPGDYRISKGLAINLKPGAGISIQGAGADVTRLIFDRVDVGIEIEMPTDIDVRSNNPGVTLSDISLLAEKRCGRAVVLRRDIDGGSGGIAAKTIRNVTIGASPYNHGIWQHGIYFDDVTFCTVTDVTCRQSHDESVAVTFTGSENPVDHYVSKLRVLGGGCGIEVSGNTEGVYIDQSTFIATSTAVRWKTFGHEPLLSFVNSHSNTKDYAIEGYNLMQPQISGNLFYQQKPDFPWVGIKLDADNAALYGLLQIHGNTFHGHPASSKKTIGIQLDRVKNGLISDNIYSAIDQPESIGSTVSHITVLNSHSFNAKD